MTATGPVIEPDEASNLAHELVRSVGDALAGPGHQALAAYLHGSLMTGDFQGGRSDVDVLMIVDGRLTDPEREAVIAQATRIVKRSGLPLDMRVVAADAAAHPERVPVIELALARHAAGELLATGCAAPEPDLLVELSLVRQHGLALLGPPPAQLVGDPPRRWILEDADRQLRRWEALIDDADHAELLVLTACRMWRFAEDGRLCSKTEAGRWALERAPALAAVARALQVRRGDASLAIEPSMVADVLARARTEVGHALDLVDGA